jgi:flagellar basal-body rod modification protein FlgD
MSTVEGVNNLNASLNELSRATQVLQGASLVGHSVLAEGDTLALTASGGLGGVELASAADSVKVTVLNEQGAVLRVLDLGGQEAGLVRFAWDGKDAAGVLQANGGYSFKVAATAAGSNVSNTTYGVGSVLSVALNTDGIEAEVSGMGVLGLDKIRQVY